MPVDRDDGSAGTPSAGGVPTGRGSPGRTELPGGTLPDPPLDAGLDAPNLTARTVTGLRWAYTQMVVSSVLHLAVAAILARLLDPVAFGIVAIGDVCLRFVNYFARMGIATAVVQKPELTPTDIRVAYTLTVALGALFSAAVWVGAPLTRFLVDDPAVIPVVRLLGLSLVVSSFGATAGSLLNRRLAFRVIALRSIASYVVGYFFVGIGLALAGAGVYALVFAVLTQTALNSVLSFLVARHSLRPALDRTSYRALLGYGSRHSLTSFLEFLGHDLDTVLIGRFAGAGPLGLYNRANLLVKMPVYQLTRSLSGVLFPAFSSVQGDRGRQLRAYQTAVATVAAVVLPIAAGMAVAARELVLVVFGDQWVLAAAVLPPLAAAVAAQMLAHLGGVLCDAVGALNQKIVLTTLKVALLATLLVLVAGRSLPWYGAALAVTEVAALLGYVRIVSRRFEAPPARLLRPYLRGLAGAAVVAAAIAFARWVVLGLGVLLPVALLVEFATGAATLALLFRFGLLRPVRREIAQRMANAGLLDPARDGPAARILRTAFGDPARSAAGASGPGARHRG